MKTIVEGKLLKDKKVCLIDSNHKTYHEKKRNAYQWYRYENGWICLNCRNKLIANPKWHPITNPKRISFKGRDRMIKINPRTGYCSNCSNNVYDKSCKRTAIHHIKYHDHDILKDIIELCISCHMKEHARLRRRI